MPVPKGKGFPVKATASARVLRQQCAETVQGASSWSSMRKDKE